MAIGQRLKDARLSSKKGMTQLGFAEEIGVCVSNISKTEQGLRFPTIDLLFEYIVTLEKYMEHTKKLTVNDRKRLEMLLNKLENDREVVGFMLDNDCKLEQEAVCWKKNCIVKDGTKQALE